MIGTRFFSAAALIAVLAASAPAGSPPIVNENFNSYADNTALWATWEPRAGNGNGPPANPFADDGVLTSDAGTYPGIQGQALLQDSEYTDPINFSVSGSINQYAPAIDPFGMLLPTADQNIVVAGDIFDGNAPAAARQSIGLRSRGATANILELGLYNSQFETYAYRVILFENNGLDSGPNWQFFALDPGFEGSDVDELVDPNDIQEYADANGGLEMWHRWEATISLTEITITLDLFRDGLTNDPLNAANSSPGVDATVVVPYAPQASGFDSLRVGGPSGSSSGRAAAYDNIFLALEDIGGGGFAADFDGDGDVDGDDFLIWQGAFLSNALGDADGDGDSDGDDFLIWQGQFGSGPGSSSGAVPEPAAFGLAVLALIGLSTIRRRHS